MNSVRANRRASFGLSLVCLLQLASQFSYASAQQANQKIQVKSPCAIRSSGCHQTNRPNSAPHGKPGRPSSGYTGNNHYKLTPIDFVDRKLDVYSFKHGAGQNESKDSKLEHLRSGREPSRESSREPSRESLMNRTVELAHPNITDRPVAEALQNKPFHFVLPDAPSLNQSFFLNATSSLPLKRANKHLIEDIYGELSKWMNLSTKKFLVSFN